MSSCNIKIFYFQEFFRAHHEFSDNFFYVRLFHRLWVARDNEKYCSIFLPAAKSRDLVKICCATSKAPNKTETFITRPSSTLKRSMPYIQRFFSEAVRDFNFVTNDTAQRNMLRFFFVYFFFFLFFSLSHSAAIFEPTQLQITQESQGCWVRDDDDDRLLAFIHFSSQCVYLQHMLCALRGCGLCSSVAAVSFIATSYVVGSYSHLCTKPYRM